MLLSSILRLFCARKVSAIHGRMASGGGATEPTFPLMLRGCLVLLSIKRLMLQERKPTKGDRANYDSTMVTEVISSCSSGGTPLSAGLPAASSAGTVVSSPSVTWPKRL